MNYQGTFAVILVICLTVEVRAVEDLVQCTSAVASCGISNMAALTATDCAGKKPFFDCLKSGGCTTSMDIYKSTSTARGYDACEVRPGADTAECFSTVASCGISNMAALTATDCAGKKPFFDCLKSGGCTTSMNIYKSTSTERGYDACGAGSIAMGFSLPILMFTLAKFFSQ